MSPTTRRNWLEPFDWAYVTLLNEELCRNRSAQHKPTSDGHDDARQLWQNARLSQLTLEDALTVCLECHRLAPFCFFNGNTFAAIARGLIKPVLEVLSQRSLIEAAALRSVVGHFVAGTEGLEELRTAIRAALSEEN